jgi:predicted XRE-type DNA-binding protein
MSDKIEITESSGNVFTDLGLENAEELQAKAMLALAILHEIEKRGLTQQQAAKLLGTDQARISKLKRGDELQRFTFDRLMNWLNRLDRDVQLVLKKKRRGRPSGTIQVEAA